MIFYDFLGSEGTFSGIFENLAKSTPRPPPERFFVTFRKIGLPDRSDRSVETKKFRSPQTRGDKKQNSELGGKVRSAVQTLTFFYPSALGPEKSESYFLPQRRLLGDPKSILPPGSENPTFCPYFLKTPDRASWREHSAKERDAAGGPPGRLFGENVPQKPK